MTDIRTGKLAIKGSPLAGENPQPFFRGKNISVAAGEGFPAEKLRGFGDETGFRILPYTRQDRYGRKLRDLEFDTVIMESDFLRAEFLPSCGGRLWSLYDKKNRRDILYKNPVFRPANLAIRDAWFSGGIEWNIGRFGHAVHTASPVFAGLVPGGREGADVLRIWEFERQTRLFWRIDFSLSDRAPILYAAVRIENPDEKEKPLYWWTNAAVPQTENVRVLSAADQALFFIPGTGDAKTMGGGRLPAISAAPGVDATFPARLDYSAEYFFQCDSQEGPPWEAAVYEDGYAFAETSTAPLLYRKMFCWGNGPGGKRWQEFLSLPGSPEYLEVQAGLAPTQLHTAGISPWGTVDFVQAFTGFYADRTAAAQEDYRAASAAVGERLFREIDPGALASALEKARVRARTGPGKILAEGSSWGALECRARPVPMPGAEKGCGYPPPGLAFPADSIGRAEKPWLNLINAGALPDWPVNSAPPGFPGSGDADLWQPLLLLNPRNSGGWLAPYYLGCIDFERGEQARAEDWWAESLRAAENPWALRNIAVAEKIRGNAETALDCYRKIFERFGSGSSEPGSAAASLDPSFIEEYIPLLLETGNEDEAFLALEHYALKKGEDAVLDGPLAECLARLAFARGDDTLLDRIFAREPPHIREGSNTLSGIWIARETRRLADREKLPPDEAERVLRARLKTGEIAVPRTIDFRMYTG